MKAGPAESREHLSVRNNHFRVVTPYAPSLPGLLTHTSGMQRSDPDFWREQRENEAEAAKTKDRAK
jgi:hypothetical protein